MKEIRKINDKWFYFPIASLAILLIYQIIKISRTIFYFPIHNFSDNTSYLAQLHLFTQYGYHNFAPNWYGGIINLKYYPPLWFFINKPLYILTNHITLTTFITAVLFLIVLFVVFLYIGKYSKLSKTKAIFLYLVFLLAPSYYFSLFKMGRFTVLLAYVFFFMCFLYLIRYKDKKLDLNFLYLLIPYSLLMLTHPSEFLLFSFLLLGLFLQRTNREKLILIIIWITTVICTSFYLIPFVDNKTAAISQLLEVLSEEGVVPLFHNLFSIGNALVILFFVVFYFYWKSHKSSKKELIFYAPMLIYSIIYFTRLYAHLPIVKNIYSLTFNSLLVFLCFYLFLKTDFKLFPIKRVILFLLQIIPIIFIVYALMVYPATFKYSQEDHDVIKLVNKIDSNYWILDKEGSTGSTLTPYVTIYGDNLITPDGWYSQAAKLDYYLDLVIKRRLLRESDDCDLINSIIDEKDVHYVSVYGDICNVYNNCNFNEIGKTKYRCLFKFE